MFNFFKEDEAMFDDFEFTPMMFWEDITYLLQKLAALIKKLFNIGADEDEA